MDEAKHHQLVRKRPSGAGTCWRRSPAASCRSARALRAGADESQDVRVDDLVVVVMRGSGFTPLEKTIMDSGDPERIVAMRHEFQSMMSKRFIDTIEELTGRNVLAFLSQAHVEPDLTLEIFFIDGPLEGFGAVEIIQPE